MCEILQSIKQQLDDIEGDCFDVQTKSDNVYNVAEPSLETMPLEILLKICSYLDAVFLKNILGKVCRRFEVILSDVSIWKHRVFCEMNGRFPPLSSLEDDNEEEIDWIETCVEMEVERRKWCNAETTTRHVVIKDVHYASVDAVILVNKGQTCISGGRDRCLALWNVLDILPEDDRDEDAALTNVKPTKIRHSAHAGWVWDLATDHSDADAYVYSASWDNTVKAWDVERGFECVETFQCGMSALSVVAFGRAVLAGLYSQKVLTFDLRCGPAPVHAYRPHRGPVLALAARGALVASVSEDRSLAVFDRAAGRVLRAARLPAERAYPASVSWAARARAACYVGDSRGGLHLFDGARGRFARSHALWPEAAPSQPAHKVVACRPARGTLACCSDRGELKFLYDCSPPREFRALRTATAEVTQLRYHGGTLAAGTCDAALELWLPREASLRTFL